MDTGTSDLEPELPGLLVLVSRTEACPHPWGGRVRSPRLGRWQLRLHKGVDCMGHHWGVALAGKQTVFRGNTEVRNGQTHREFVEVYLSPNDNCWIAKENGNFVAYFLYMRIKKGGMERITGNLMGDSRVGKFLVLSNSS